MSDGQRAAADSYPTEFFPRTERSISAYCVDLRVTSTNCSYLISHQLLRKRSVFAVFKEKKGNLVHFINY